MAPRLYLFEGWSGDGFSGGGGRVAAYNTWTAEWESVPKFTYRDPAGKLRGSSVRLVMRGKGNILLYAGPFSSDDQYMLAEFDVRTRRWKERSLWNLDERWPGGLFTGLPPRGGMVELPSFERSEVFFWGGESYGPPGDDCQPGKTRNEETPELCDDGLLVHFGAGTAVDVPSAPIAARADAEGTAIHDGYFVWGGHLLTSGSYENRYLTDGAIFWPRRERG